MDKEQLINLAQDVIQNAKKQGADNAEVTFVQSMDSSIQVREGKIENSEYSDSSHIGIRIFIGQKLASVSSSDFSESSLSSLLERAVQTARYVPEDKYAGLMDKEFLEDSPNYDLGCFEENLPTTEALTNAALECEASALSQDGITNSEGASCAYGTYGLGLVTSKGFAGFYKKTVFGLSCSVIAGSGTDMQVDYDYSMSPLFLQLENAQTIGLNAAQRTVKKLFPKKMRSGNYPIVFDKRAGRSLLSNFSGAICADSIARKSSFLGNCLEKQIFSDSIHITDDPHIRSALATIPFDGEGVRNPKLSIVENGVVKNLFVNGAAGRQLEISSNGRASRSIGSPYCSSTNLYMHGGTVSHEELLSDIKYGLYVTETIGHGINEVTGDYSIGASGFIIENGVLTYPVSQITIAGNLKDMFLNMTPANDLEMKMKKNVPTLRIEGMTVAGE